VGVGWDGWLVPVVSASFSAQQAQSQMGTIWHWQKVTTSPVYWAISKSGMRKKASFVVIVYLSAKNIQQIFS
jgi:hypothetical protein